MATLTKQQQNDLIVASIRIAGMVILAVIASKVRQRLESRP